MSTLLSVCLALTLTAVAEDMERTEETQPTGLQFEYAYQLALSADDARDKQQFPAAIVLYEEAIREYVRLTTDYPDWQPGISRFRQDYCRQERNIILERTGITMSNAMLSVASDVNIKLPSGLTSSRPQARMPKLKADASELLKEGKSDEARELLLRALRISPDDQTLRQLIATAQCQQGHFDDAVYILEDLVVEAPSSANTHLLLGAAYLGLGDMESARSSLERAIEIDPNTREGHYNLARMMVIGDTPDLITAEKHYRWALELGAKPDVELEALLLQAGHRQGATSTPQ